MSHQINYLKEIQKEGNVKSHFQKQQELYSADINMAIYMDLSDIQKLNIFQIISVNDKQDFLVNFYSFRMKNDDHMNQKLYKLFIRQMDSLLRNQSKRKYYAIVFQTLSENKNGFDIFRQMYKKLPALYFIKLNKVYNIQPAFLTKSLSFIQFTSWSKLFYRHVEYIESIEQIQQISELKIFNVLAKCPKQLTNGIKIQKQTPNLMVKSAFVGTKKAKPFDSLKRQFGDYQIDQIRGVPLILSILIQTMKQSRDLCLLEGIFRTAGSIQDEQQLLKQIINFQTFKTLNAQAYCKRSIAGLMKKIFTQAHTPLIPYLVYNYLLNVTIDEQNIRNIWISILDTIPSLNKRILCYVTQFLRDFILKNKQQNKMSSHNLAVVFNPCFFRAKQCSLADLMNSGKFAALFKWWLQNYNQIIRKPNDINQLNVKVKKSSKQQQMQIQTVPESLKERNRKNVQKIRYQGGLNSQNSQFLQ